MTDKQVVLDLIADVASPTEVIFEDGQSSNEWLAPYDLRLTVLNPRGPNGYQEVNIIGDTDNLNRFLSDQDLEGSVEEVK